MVGGRVVYQGGLLWQGVISTWPARQTSWPASTCSLAGLLTSHLPGTVGLRFTPHVAGQDPIYPGFNVPPTYFDPDSNSPKSCSSERAEQGNLAGRTS